MQKISMAAQTRQLPIWLLITALVATPAFADQKLADDEQTGDAATTSPSEPSEASASTATTETAPSNGDPLQVYEEVEVRERVDDLLGLATSAAEGSVGRLDLARRPISRPGELIETAPGVVATQHSGGGKANQFFVRGFNLDHGTDFSLRVAGIPVNMPTHGHGQGYADLNFVIPEMVDRVRYRKGPYYADVGDFSAAGSADMQLRSSLEEGVLQVTGGSYGYGRVLWAEGRPMGNGEFVAAIDVFNEDGPWTREQEYQGYKGLLRYTAGDAMRGHSVTVMGYDADWLSTDQVPLRAVESGQIGRFDLIDDGPRGRTERFSLSAEVHRGTANTYSELSAYVLAYDFGLVSNFTYFLEDTELGDQFEQIDDRIVFGVDARSTRSASWGDRRLEIGYGASLRFDDIENGLFRTSRLTRTSTVRQDRIEQLHGGAWADVLVHWSDSFRTRIGLRGDAVDADVRSDLELNSGSEDDFQLSPKLSAIWAVTPQTEISLNLGHGFHSNDARGTVISVDPTNGEAATRVDPLVRARGADIGVRTHLGSRWHTTLTAFYLELDSELVFVGDGGATEASRESRRRGVEWANFYQANKHVSFELDLTLTDAEFTDGAPEGEEIPGAIGTTIAAGLSFEDLFTSRLGSFRGALRWRYFGDVPLIEDGSVEWSSSSVLNARFGYSFDNGLDLVLDVFNALDSQDSDIEYFYASRLAGEAAGGIEDIHFHPMESRSARLTLAWRH